MQKRILIIISIIITFGLLVAACLAGFFNPFVVSNLPKETVTKSSEWRLLVDGFVERPLNLTLTELVEMTRSTVNAELICVGAVDSIVAKGNWTGVRLRLILEKAGIFPEAMKVAFYAKDNYTTDLTVEIAMRDDILVAYAIDGKSLPEKLRLVVPGKWGYKWISGIVHIELVNYDFKGTWESMGYSDEANIQSHS